MDEYTQQQHATEEHAVNGSGVVLAHEMHGMWSC